MAEPVAWNNRSSSATARAVAEKATTIPVITSACGTGSPPNPVAAPLRATTPNSTNTPLPTRLKARIFRNGCGFVITPVKPEADERGAREADQGRRGHRSPFRCGVPTSSMPSVAAIETIIATSIVRISALA